MTSVVFNTDINLGNLESFKLLPNELHGNIADYIDCLLYTSPSPRDFG